MNTDLLALINSDAEVNAIAAGRIYWQTAPQAPAADAVWCVITRTSGAIGIRHDGLSLVNEARLQFDCFGPTFAQAQALRDKITNAIGGRQPVTQGSTDFRAFIPQAPRDFPPVNNIHRCLADILVTYRPAPTP